MSKDRELQLCYLEDWREIWRSVIADDKDRINNAVVYHARRIASHTGETVAVVSRLTHERVKKHWPQAQDNLNRIERELKR